MGKPEVDIVIRFKNEEFWLKKLKSKFEKLKNANIFLHAIDNDSEDQSKQIFEQFDNINLKDKTYLTISDYKPGSALNLGAKQGNCRFIIFLSAHCIPKSDDYILQLLNALQEEEDQCAGAFGRQLPLACSGPQNTVDLLLTYPKEDRILRRTPLFNNANSIVKRDVFDKYNFDENVSNIEDLIWAKKLLEIGYHFKYTSGAEVYHYHGIHQHKLHSGNSRVSNSLQVLLKSGWLEIDYPSFCNYKSMKLVHIFKDIKTEIITKISYGTEGNLNTAIVEKEELEPQSIDYVVFSKKKFNKNIVTCAFEEVARLTSKISIIKKSKSEHNLQQELTRNVLVQKIKDSKNEMLFISSDVYRDLEKDL